MSSKQVNIDKFLLPHLLVLHKLEDADLQLATAAGVCASNSRNRKVSSDFGGALALGCISNSQAEDCPIVLSLNWLATSLKHPSLVPWQRTR